MVWYFPIPCGSYQLQSAIFCKMEENNGLQLLLLHFLALLASGQTTFTIYQKYRLVQVKTSADNKDSKSQIVESLLILVENIARKGDLDTISLNP